MRINVAWRYLPGLIGGLSLLLVSCGSSSSQRWSRASNAESIFHQVDSPVYGKFPLLPAVQYERFYKRSMFYMNRSGSPGAHPVAIMLHGCAGLGEFYDNAPFRVHPDKDGNYQYEGGISTYLSTYANFFADMGVIPYIIDSNGPRVEELVPEGDLVVSCYDTLDNHAAYIATRLEDVRRAIVYLWAKTQQIKSGNAEEKIFPDLSRLYIIGWSQGAETILRFTMDVDYEDGDNVLNTMESPFARLDQLTTVQDYPLNLIGIYPAAGHLLSRVKYLKSGATINTAIFTGTVDDFSQDVHDFQVALQRLPGKHRYREYRNIPHSYDKDQSEESMIEATNDTRRTIASFIRMTLN